MIKLHAQYCKRFLRNCQRILLMEILSIIFIVIDRTSNYASKPLVIPMPKILIFVTR